MEKRMLWIHDVITCIFVLLMYVIENSIIVMVFGLFLLYHMSYFIKALRLKAIDKMDYVVNQTIVLVVLFVVYIVMSYMNYDLFVYHNPFGYLFIAFIMTYLFGCKIQWNRLDK